MDCNLTIDCSRRRFLAAVGTTTSVGLAGCARSANSIETHRDSDAWSLPDHDTHNTKFNPHAAGPQASPSRRWELEAGYDRPDWRGVRPRSSIIHGDRVFVGGTDISAHEIDDGSTIWSEPLETTDAGIATDGEHVFVTFEPLSGLSASGPTGIAAFAVDDGTPEWTLERDWWAVVQPTVAGDRIYCNQGGSVSAISVAGEFEWNATHNLYSSSQPAVTDDSFYVSFREFDRTREYADASDTDLASGTRRFDTSWPVVGAPVAVDDYVLLPETINNPRHVELNNASLRVFEDDGTAHWSREIGAACWSPAVADGTVYVQAGVHREVVDETSLDRVDGSSETVVMKRDGAVHAIDLETGNDLWTLSYPGFGNWQVSPVVADGILYVALYDSIEDTAKLVAIEDGSQRWSYDLPLPAVDLAIAEDVLVVTLDDRSVLALS